MVIFAYCGIKVNFGYLRTGTCVSCRMGTTWMSKWEGVKRTSHSLINGGWHSVASLRTNFERSTEGKTLNREEWEEKSMMPQVTQTLCYNCRFTFSGQPFLSRRGNTFHHREMEWFVLGKLKLMKTDTGRSSVTNYSPVVSLMTSTTSSGKQKHQIDFLMTWGTRLPMKNRRRLVKEKKVINLERGLGRDKCETLCLEKLLLQDTGYSFVKDQQASDFAALDSTAVPSVNPRLREAEHVHDRFVHCDGLHELATSLVEAGNIGLSEIPYPEMWNPRFLSQVACWNSPMREIHKLEIYTDGSGLWSRQTGEMNAGWGMVVVAKDKEENQYLLGTLASHVIVDRQDPHCTGASANDSDAAETDALIWAGLWALQRPEEVREVEIEIFSDSKTKLKIAEGTWNAQLSTQALVTHAVMNALVRTSRVTYTWTRAHQGNLYNELADHVAKSAARFPDEFWPRSNVQNLLSFGDALNWVWAVIDPKKSACGLIEENDDIYFRRPKPMRNTEFFKEQHICTVQQEISMSLRTASFNVNTLRGKSNGVHKEALVIHHMMSQKICVLGLQETRRRQTKQWQRGDVFGISIAAEKGQGGVDVVINKNIPYAYDSSKPLYLTPQDVTVIAANSQCLFVKVKTDFTQWFMIIAHAPHCGSDLRQKESFWSGLVHQVKDMGLPVVLMIDANARLGQLQQEGVGTFGAQKADENTPFFMKALEELHLAVPSTFEKYGIDPKEEQGTWYHKGKYARLDYVAIPREWMKGRIRACVQDVELAETYRDHRLVWASMEVGIACNVVQQVKHPKPDRLAMRTPQGKETIRWLAAWFIENREGQVPENPDELLWEYENYMNGALIYWFPSPKQTQREQWISQNTWDKLAQVKRLRRYVRLSHTYEKKGFMRQILSSWRNETAPQPSSIWLKGIQMARAWATRQCDLLAQTTKNDLRKEEANFFETCLQNFEKRCSDANATDLWKIIKRHLPKTKARMQSRALRFSKTMATFEEHFAHNEAAVQMSADQLQDRLHRNSAKALEMSSSIPIDVAQIPTLFEFEQALRRSTPGKAHFGPAVPEWFAYAPRESAQALYPLLLDMWIYFQEPAAMKGGAYFPLWKQKGSQSSPENYRAILISSYIGKALHHILRKRLVRALPRVLSGLQLGGLPKQRVQFGSQIIGLLRKHASVNHRSHSVIFFDLVSAFYHTPRELIVDNILEYDDVPLTEEVNLLPICQDTATEKAQVHPQLRGVLQESLTCSWFNVMGVPKEEASFWVPGKGTRPGDSCADLYEEFVMTGILEDFIQDIGHHLPMIDTGQGCVQVPPVTWVDDVALVVEHEDPNSLLKITAEVAKLKHWYDSKARRVL